jgi:RNA polymerase sigma factor (sigma-70 family)
MAGRNSVNTKKEKRNPNHVSEPASEARLVAAAKGGNCASFELLCAPHAARLLATALRITRNRQDAEDAVQDSLMRAYVRINAFRGASSFATWLTRIVINSALMIRRKSRSGRYLGLDGARETDESPLNVDIPHPAPDPEQTFVDQERERALREAISTLRPRVRAVLEAGQLRELSIKETAKVLNISVGAAKTRLFHARTALRRSSSLRATMQSRTEPAA